jgi:hypothetical protein
VNHQQEVIPKSGLRLQKFMVLAMHSASAPTGSKADALMPSAFV